MEQRNKIIIIYIILFLIYIVNSQCNIKNPLSPQPYIICSVKSDILFYPYEIVSVTNYSLNFSDLTRLPLQNTIIGTLTPHVAYFPDVETYGGINYFTGFFFLQYSDSINSTIIQTLLPPSISEFLDFKYDSEIKQINLSYVVPRGNCSFNFFDYTVNYKNATITSQEITPKDGFFSIPGTSLNGISVNVKDEVFPKNINFDGDNIKYGENDTSAEYFFNDFKYSGKWFVKITQCEKTIYNKNLTNNPIINQISFVPSAGGPVTITGRYLYPRNGDNNLIKITLKKNTATTSVDCVGINYDLTNAGGSESITCTLPPKGDVPNDPQTLTITVNTLDISTKFYYGQPSISKVEYNGNNDVTIYCKNYPSEKTSIRVKVPFGFENYAESSYIKEYNVINTTESNANETSGIIHAKLPSYSIPGFLSLLFDNFTLESQIFNKLFLEPIVKGITSSNTLGGKITIYGSSLYINNYLNQTIENSFIKINNKECFPFENGNGSYITCDYGAGSGKDLPFSIVINGNEYNNNNLIFSYQPPSIIDLIQNFNDNTISIIGNNFGNSNETAIVYFNNNNREKVNIRSISHEIIIIDIKNEFYGNYTIQTLIGEGVHAQDTDRPFLGPVLPIITKVTNVDCAGGIVNVTGKYLNKDMQISFKSTNDKIKRKPIPCIILKDQIINNKFIQCQVFGRNGQEGNSTTFTSGKNFSVIAINGDKEGYTDGTSFSFNPPIINFSYNFTKDIANQISTIKFDCKNINRYGLKLFIDDVECNNIQIELPFTVLSCSYPSLKSLGYISINKTIWNSKISKINITVDGQTSNFEASIFNFQENIEPPKASLYYLAAVAVCGAIAVGTIIAIIVYKYKRYKRIQKINKILKNPDIYNLNQTQNNINSVS